MTDDRTPIDDDELISSIPQLPVMPEFFLTQEEWARYSSPEHSEWRVAKAAELREKQAELAAAEARLAEIDAQLDAVLERLAELDAADGRLA